ncbi:MAG: ATP-binding cassette domain-containing protein [Agathobacter sp.]|nr:ATP-binding cassette domain-containing protein [Agathobacter sp.]
MIEINNLVKKYGEHVAVDRLSLKLENGRIYGLLGANGAGKSSTMNIVTGYLGATSGEIKVDGFDIMSKPKKAKEHIGYLPEIPPLYLEMTVREYMDFVAGLKKLDKKLKEKYILDAMEETGLLDVSDRLIKNLSKGYRQRVGLAQAILGNPDNVILDEPMVGLDPKQIIEIRDLIKKLGENHTVLLSSHILTEISAVCDHVFIISKGKLVASDTTENLLNQMSGVREIKLQVKIPLGKDKNIVTECLSDIENIEQIDEEDNENDEIYSYTIKADCKKDIREQIFKKMVENSISILELHTVEKSLEDVFLELTQEGEER